MYLCIGILAFSAITLAQVSAYYHHTLKLYQNGERRNSKPAKTIEFDSPYGMTFGWCAAHEIAHNYTEEPGVLTVMLQLEGHSQWDCTFIAMINRSVNCITRFQTKLKSIYVITLNPERDTEFTMEYNQPEAQIRVQSPSIITMGRCALRHPATILDTVYFADSSVTLSGEGVWLCHFSMRDHVVRTEIRLRRAAHNRIYEIKDGVTTMVAEMAQGRMDSLLTISEIECHSNESSIIRHPLNSSYVSFDKSGNDHWECNIHDKSNNSCTFTVREVPSGPLVKENTVRPPLEESTVSADPPTSVSLGNKAKVLVYAVVGVALVIIPLICVIFYYKNKVKNLERNNIPPNIISRAPFEMPPEIVYDSVYSHPAGLKRPGPRKEKKTDQKQLIDVK